MKFEDAKKVVEYENKVHAVLYNAARGKTCEIEGCNSTPDGFHKDLCEKHETELVESMKRYDLEVLLKELEPELWEQYLEKNLDK